MRRHPGLFLRIIVIVAIAAAFLFIRKTGAQRCSRGAWGSISWAERILSIRSIFRKSPLPTRIGGLRSSRRDRKARQPVRRERAGCLYCANRQSAPSLIVDLAGMKNVTDAINQIGQTPLLDFAEVDSRTVRPRNIFRRI